VSGKPAAYIKRFLDSRADRLEEIVYTAVGVQKP